MATKPNPEMLPGELFLGNEQEGRPKLISHWESLRRGKVAYDADGELLPGWFPLFVSWDEVVSRGYDPTTFGPQGAKRKIKETA